MSIKALHRAMPALELNQIGTWLDAGQGAPVSRAAMVLTNAPRGKLSALIMPDAALAQALGWDYLVPLLAQGLSRADLGKRGEDLRLALSSRRRVLLHYLRAYRCPALDMRLCGFIEQVSNEFNFVENAGFVVCKMSLLDSSECFNSFQCVSGRA